MIRKGWRIWAKALGDKSGKSDREADFIAIIRTLIFLQLIITNCFIVAGNIRHWNDNVPTEPVSKINSNVTKGTHYENNRRTY
tara:strand:- start:211 stop:459 length:249 start_codon:yes stop_codon:yes gene_type:complete